MKFTVNWLKQYVDFELPSSELSEKLTMLGLEVDAVDELFRGLDLLQVAEITSVSKHPNADTLVLCKVNIGEDEDKHIVCGAPNTKVGMLTAIALPGLVLPGGFKIKKSKIRGEVSEGMLCSERDLGLGDSHEGIMELPATCKIGQPLAEAINLADTLIEVDLTPNRPDCTSVIGIAREVAGCTGGKLKPVIIDGMPPLSGSDKFTVEVEAPDACPRYSARLLKNIKIAPSPWWLRRTLIAVGLRPINNIVDITNFVMLEQGQPLHAFDFAKLTDGKIIVRKAHKDEKVTTLDGTEHDTDQDMLLICDAKNPVAVAGVMGGANSEVSDSTTDVLLESAYFDAISVRRTSRNLKLGTDASYRFERGVDPNGTINALDRAAQLMVEIAGAELDGNGSDICSDLPHQKPIELRLSKTIELLGIDLSIEQMAAFLNGIEIPTKKKDQDTLIVSPPTFRVDLEREIDLVEEIARLKGYDVIASTMPAVPMSFSEQTPDRILRHKLTSILVSSGLSEAINYSFISVDHYDKLDLPADSELRNSVELLNPLTEDQGLMRSTLMPGLLDNIRHNLNRQNNNIALFEIGKTFQPVEGAEQPSETYRLCAIISGRRQPGSPIFHYGSNQVSIYDVKGIAGNICRELRLIVYFEKKSSSLSYCDQDQTMDTMVENQSIGQIGKISTKVLKNFGIKQDAYFLDLNIDAIQNCRAADIKFQPLSKFPAVKWDLAFVVNNKVGAGDIINAIINSGFSLVKHAEIFDIYSGKPIADGHKSIALSITYHSETSTLNDKKVGKVHKKIIELVKKQFNGQLREE